MRHRFRVLLACAVLLVACKDGKGDGDKKKSSEGSAKGPKDVDVDAVLSDVKCKSDDDRKGCSCLREFDSAKAFDDLPDDGGSTWVGRTYALGGSGDGTKQYFFLQLKSGKADDDTIESAKLKADAVLDVKASARALFPENDDEEADAKSLVKAASGGAKAPKDSEAAKFVRTSKPENGYHPVAKTKGKSKIIAEEHGAAYMRADGDRLLLVEAGEGDINMGDKKKKLTAKAFCTELWKVR
ncbi:MAG: hypothetical protein ACXWP4_18690 [Polyangiales bacterium]